MRWRLSHQIAVGVCRGGSGRRNPRPVLRATNRAVRIRHL